jgi:malate dehydrogenase (oxaloacetate-decarboxylating)
MKAIQQGVARRTTTYEEEYERAARMIRASRDMTRILMEEGFIPDVPDAENAR